MQIPIAEKREKAKSSQLYGAFLVSILFFIALYYLQQANSEGALLACFGLAFGYILQRSRFCFAAGFRDIFMIRNTTVTRSILLLLLITGLGFALVSMLMGRSLALDGYVFPVGVHTVVGGLLFGFGMVIAGNCVSGCLMRMGEGYIMQWFTFGGLLFGSALGAWHLGWWAEAFIDHSPTIFVPALLGWPASIGMLIILTVGCLILALWFERGKVTFSLKKIDLQEIFSAVFIGPVKEALQGRIWSYGFGAVMLAFLNILLFYLWGKPLGITGGLTHLAGWLSRQIGVPPDQWYYFKELIFLESRHVFLEHPFIYLSVAIVTGSLISSLVHGEFRIRKASSYRFICSALVGGILLGYSARIAMGCNIGGFWSGVASFSLHGWVFGLFILVGSFWGGKIFIRFLL